MSRAEWEDLETLTDAELEAEVRAMSRDAILQMLWWNDPNGDYEPERHGDEDPVDTADLADMLIDQVKDNRPANPPPRPPPTPAKPTGLATLSRAEVERTARNVEAIHAWETARVVAKAFAKVFRSPIEKVARVVISEYWEGESRRWSSATMKPTTVLIMTEPPSPIEDPYSEYQGDDGDSASDLWERTLDMIRKDPFIEDAGWESINPAVQYVWIVPKIVG